MEPLAFFSCGGRARDWSRGCSERSAAGLGADGEELPGEAFGVSFRLVGSHKLTTVAK